MSSFGDEKRIRVALLGCGMMGKEHASYLQSFPRTKVSFICDPVEAMRKEMLKLLQTKPSSREKEDELPLEISSEAELLQYADQIDLLVVATPNYLHTPSLLQWGKLDMTILLEKPAAVSHQQIQHLDEFKASDGFIARVWVAMEYRYIPAISKLISLLPEIGDSKMVTIRENRYPFLQKVGDWNRRKESTGDTLVEKCCHFFDLFRVILGQELDREAGMKTVAQRGLNYQNEDSFHPMKTPIIDSAYVLMSFREKSGKVSPESIKDDTIGCLELCMYAEGSRHQEEVIVTGTHGRLEAYLPENKVFHFYRPTNDEWTDKTVPPPRGREVVYDCSDIKSVHDISMDKFPTHTGYHYASTAVEWYRLLHCMAQYDQTGEWNPEVSLHDGIEAVKMGLAATDDLKWTLHSPCPTPG